MRALRLTLAIVCLLGLAALLVGCGSGNSSSVFLNLYQRAFWSQAENGRIPLTAFGGNGLLYVYSIPSGGGGVTLLTPSLNDPDNLLEGGEHPAYNPAGDTIAFASRRAVSGNIGNSLALYTMSATGGDRAGLVKITDDAGAGADLQPSWNVDGTRIIYTTTRETGIHHIRTASADGSGGIADLLNDGEVNEWPFFNPQNNDEFVYQTTRGETSDTDTNIFVYTISTGEYEAISLTGYTDGGPSWSPDGSMIAFHSNRSGDFDIYVFRIEDDTLIHVTNDARSDGFPVWSADGTELAFTRDRELWTTNLDGSDQKQLTRRF